MDKLKKLTDEEIINLLREHGIPHGPIVDTTRTLYEKKLFEYERKKKTYPGSAESSYESKQQYSTREYDANQGSHINVGEMAVGVQHNQQNQMELLELAKLASTSCLDMTGAIETGLKMGAIETGLKMGAKETRQKVRARKATQKVGARKATQKVGARKATQKVDARKATQKVGARKAIQKVGTRETRQKIVVREMRPKTGGRVTRQNKGVVETEHPVSPANPVPDLSATASIVLGTEEPGVQVAALSPSKPRQAKCNRPSPQRLHKPKLTGALKLKMQRQAEENPSYVLAMSLVPLLDKVPEEKNMALRHDLLHLISSYYPDAPPKPLQPSSTAPPPASVQHK